MADSKTYLNVPYAEKDDAKALGARWDAVEKKWFVPAGKDIAPFACWQAGAGAATPTGGKAASGKVGAASAKSAIGVITHAAGKDFVAYNGDAPPWD